MTDSASGDAAPAHEPVTLDETPSTVTPAPEEHEPANGDARRGSMNGLSKLDVDVERELSSGSELTPVRSDDDDYGSESMGQLAFTTEDATNGHIADSEERPAKRRRVSTPPPNPSKKRIVVESPPWKKVEAEGPTRLVTDDGKRKSGRIARVAQEPQPPTPKRAARGAQSESKSTPAAKDKQLASKANGYTNGKQRTAVSKASAKKSAANSSRPTPRTSRRRSPSPPSSSAPKYVSTGTRRSSRTRRESLDSPLHDAHYATQDGPVLRQTRIRLRVNPPSILLVHPAQANVLPGQTVARAKVGDSFPDYIAKAPHIDVKDGGWKDDTEDGPVYSDEQAVKDARLLTRIENEARPGGLLSEELCSLYVPEPAEEPPRQWTHHDHTLKAAANFRKLMVFEQQRHRAAAKKIAEACRDEWTRRQPKTAEQVEAEETAVWIGRFRVVMKALAGTWENVRTEINRRRLEEWEAAEQRRVKAALNEAVNKSEMQLQARRAQRDSEMPSDDESTEDEDLDDSDMADEDSDDADLVSEEGDESNEERSKVEDDNMSSSDDDEDAKSNVSDADLTQEQLREKYANIPKLSPSRDAGNGAEVTEVEDEETQAPAGGDDDTSDESIDMDDDMGSSAGSSESADEESDEEEPAGTLGFLFGKSELKKMKEQATTDMPQEDIEMDDAPSAVPNGINADKQFEGDPNPCVEEPMHPQEQNRPDGQAEHDNREDLHQATERDAAGTISEPLAATDVAAELPDVAKRARPGDGRGRPAEAVPEAPIAMSSVEATGSANAMQTSPGTDAITNTASRDPTQSPRTSDTRPSDEDTASSVVKSAVSRSASPLAHTPQTELPFLLRGSLREYQHFGLDWLAGLYENQTNGILADEMGLGKTIQTIALLAHLACHHEAWGPHLVVVPTSVMLNWEMEFKKWCPGFKVLSYYGSIEERKRKRQGWKSDDLWNVCITSYQIVLQDHQVFKRRRWHYMILDEAHNIKNFKSKRWQTLLTFNTRARLLLTGTPLQNNLTELWSLLFFLMPSENGVGGFADLAEFQDWFHKPESQILESGREQMDEEARAIIAKLHKVLRPYLLRRLKADVEKQMPAKYEHVEFCRLSRRQRELYDGFLSRTDTREALSSGNYISVINCLMQLRKVCNHPDLFVERPIMTSFRQHSSVVSEYSATHHLLKDKFLAPKLMNVVSLDFLNLIPTKYEHLSSTICERAAQLNTHQALMGLREAQKARAQAASANWDPSTVESNLMYLESVGRWGRFEELQHCVYLNALRRQQRPIYGKRLLDHLTIGVSERPQKARPKVPAKIMAWFEDESPVLRSMVMNADQRAASLKSTISKFACITPAVVTRDVDRFILGSKGVNAFNETNLRLSAPVRYFNAPFMPKAPPLDPWHEARMRLSIQFPDKRLLQYDCGKLQALDRLLRKLQAGGHRALIFTQMTKVLDILEQFLNIHGHKYLRLDGATKVEQRQILTERFNNDPRILAFILSTRSGGLGINLTGADTVIFYDQDWNPAMDKQCQDRCHRIGQTRDVHIYRLVSEHTIEANILRKASQKQMLDDVVIQEGGFTTDYFNKLSVQDVMRGVGDEVATDVVGNAMDRVLGGPETAVGGDRAVGNVLAQAEDREDVDAARVAEREIQEDEADFDEKAPTASASGTSTARHGTPNTGRDGSVPAGTGGGGGLGRSNLGLHEQRADGDGGGVAGVEVELNAWGERMRDVDAFMLGTMARLLENTPLELPKDKKKGKKNNKKGKDTRKR